MKRFFGYFLFVLGAVDFVFTAIAFYRVGFESIFVASFVIAVLLLLFGVVLSYDPNEEILSEEELNSYHKNGSINERLGQL